MGVDSSFTFVCPLFLFSVDPALYHKDGDGVLFSNYVKLQPTSNHLNYIHT